MDYAAGVLIYHVTGNKIMYLLGHDFRRVWSDFGGKSDPYDEKLPHITAARECYEETMGVVRTLDFFQKSTQECAFVEGKTYMMKKYFMYLVKLDDMNDYNADMDIVKKFSLDEHLSEKNQLRWVDENFIMNNPNIRKVFYNTFITNLNVIRNLCLTDTFKELEVNNKKANGRHNI